MKTNTPSLVTLGALIALFLSTPAQAEPPPEPTLHYWCAMKNAEGFSYTCQSPTTCYESRPLEFGSAAPAPTDEHLAGAFVAYTDSTAAFSSSRMYYLAVASGGMVENRVLSYNRQTGQFSTHHYDLEKEQMTAVTKGLPDRIIVGSTQCAFRDRPFRVRDTNYNFQVLDP